MSHYSTVSQSVVHGDLAGSKMQIPGPKSRPTDLESLGSEAGICILIKGFGHFV